MEATKLKADPGMYTEEQEEFLFAVMDYRTVTVFKEVICFLLFMWYNV